MNPESWLAVEKVGATPERPAQWNFYCGRYAARTPAGFIFADLGNPYPINEYQTREQCISKFHDELDAKETPRSLEWWKAIHWLSEALRRGETIRLWCHCKPKACHCDIIQARAIIPTLFDE